MYSTVSEEFATSMVESLIDYMGEDWVPGLQYGYIYSTSGNLGLYCNIIVDGKYYLNWLTEGYDEFIDWSLSEEWYTTEFTKDNSQKLYDLMQKDLDTLSTNMDKVSNESK